MRRMLFIKFLSTGRLGLGNQDCMASPQPVAVSEDIRPCSVYCGVDCSVILTLDGTLLCCGNNRLNIFINCSIMLQYM